MTIEIYSPRLQVKQEVLARIEKKLTSLSHLSEKISRAEIFLTEDTALVKQNKVCKIRLDIFGDTLFAHKHAESFEKAAAEAIKILKRHLKQKTRQKNEPPDEITSTVKV
jgi:ribosome-associated translation inhibitor RaiA